MEAFRFWKLKVAFPLHCPCNIPDPASLRKVVNPLCLLSDLIHWGFLDVFKLQVLTCLVFLHVCEDK